MVDAGNRLVQQLAVGIGQAVEQAPVLGNFQQRGSRRTQAFEQIRRFVGSGGFRIFSGHGTAFRNNQPRMIARMA